MEKVRVDTLLHTQGLAESRSQAQRLVMAGRVRADGELVHKPATLVSQSAILTITQPAQYVSRGGEKLAAALDAFAVNPAGLHCADVGASTGGFSDCLLQRGAARVYAIEVGQGILHWKLRQNQRITLLEGTNVRYLERLPGLVSLVTVDVSFISLKLVLPVLRGWYGPSGGEAIVLVKPQFEAGKAEASRGKGVIRDLQIHREVLLEVLNRAQELGFGIQGLIRSPLLGSKGNTEFFAWLSFPGTSGKPPDAFIEGIFTPGPPDP